MKNKVFVVIPARNEEKHVAKVVREAKKLVNNVVVVDDGSDDKTAKAAENAKAMVLKHVINLGKGAALKTGCDYAVKEGADIIIAMDADGQHEASDIKKFLEALKSKEVVLAYRKPNRKMPAVLKFGNWFINKTISFLYGVRVRDSQCGFRAFTSRAYRKIRWKSSDYSMESEMVAKIGSHKLKYGEVPIETIYSDRYKGTTILDGAKIVFNLLLWKLNRL